MVATIQDILPHKSSGKKVEIDAVLPFLVLPVLMLIATISRAVTITVMVVIGMGALYVHSRPRQKNRLVSTYHWHLYFHRTILITILIIFMLLERF